MGQVCEDAGRALKWVLADNEAGPLRATEAAGRVLAQVQPDQPLNIVTIVGAARKGKSFLMNALTRQDGMFRASAGTPPCTAGADLSQALMSLSDFKNGRGSTTDRSTWNPTIAFVDMEGQGDKSTDHDVRLATPFLLVSKVGAVFPSPWLDRHRPLCRCCMYVDYDVYNERLLRRIPIAAQQSANRCANSEAAMYYILP